MTPPPPRLPHRFLFTDETRLADPLPAIAALPPGSGVVFRHYSDPGRGALARAVAELCRERGVLLVVAGDATLARAIGAAGLHLPEGIARRGRPRRWRRRPGSVLTVSAHSRRAICCAVEVGADAVFLAPVFATASHPAARPLGVLRFAALTRGCPLPVYALGGMSPAAMRRLRGTGCRGIAGIGLFVRRSGTAGA